MASQKRVLHIQRGFHMSATYALQVMRDHCTITWDIPGQTIRDTTDEERIALRAEQAQQAKRLEPLAHAELPGIKYEPSVNGVQATKREGKLLWEAHDFVMQAA
jgi:hypothetical protein